MYTFKIIFIRMFNKQHKSKLEENVKRKNNE